MDELQTTRPFEDEALLMAMDMVDSLPKTMQDRLFHMDKDRMPKKVKQELFSTLLLSLMESQDYRKRFCQAALEKPLEAAKLAVAVIPKTAEIQSDIRVQHAIVVPASVALEHWSKPEAERAIDTLSWSDDLSGTVFGGQNG